MTKTFPAAGLALILLLVLRLPRNASVGSFFRKLWFRIAGN